LTTANAAEATIEGFELELAALPVEGLELHAAVGHLNARYRRLDPAAMAAGLALTQRFVNTPEWTASLAASYRFELGGLGSLTPRVDWYYSSAVEHSVLNEPQHHQPGYSLLNASLTFRDPSERFEIVLAGRNITDKTYIIAGHTNATVGIVENVYARPAEWSLTLRWRF
jgi:iron complex outermembrane receptor protein